jgi:exopolysaccharide production protein ExoQ
MQRLRIAGLFATLGFGLRSKPQNSPPTQAFALSEPEPQVRRAVISWNDVRAWGKTPQGQEAGPPKRGWRAIDVDGVFAFALFLPLLFAGNLGQAGKPVFIGLFALYAILRGRDLPRILAPRLFLLIPAVLAAASTYWSELPDLSLTQGLGLGVTILAAMMLSAAQSPGAVFRGVTAAYLTYLVAARASGVTMQGGMGEIGATSTIVALGATVMAVRERSWVWAAVGMVAGAFEISALVQARPASAVMGAAVALVVVLLMAAVVKANIWIRGGVAFLAGAGALTVGVFARTIAGRMTEFGHGWVVRNPNLINPSDGWAQARALIAKQQLLGKGYYGVWHTEPGSAATHAASAVAQAPGVLHNSYIDILLQFGWVGLWVIGITLTLAVLGFAKRFVWRPNLALCIWGGVLAYELVRIQLDVIGYAPFSTTALLLGAALGAAFSPELAARPERKAPPERLEPATVTHLHEYRERKAKKADPAFRHPDRPS